MFEKCATAQIATLRIFFGTKFESQMSRARSEIIFREKRSEKNVFENNCLIVFRTLGYSYDISQIKYERVIQSTTGRTGTFSDSGNGSTSQKLDIPDLQRCLFDEITARGLGCQGSMNFSYYLLTECGMACCFQQHIIQISFIMTFV